MKLLIRTLLFAILLAGCEVPVSPTGTETGIVTDGFGNNVITEFLFDKNGYVWMVPSSGRCLFKMDGSIIIRYDHDPEQPGSLAASKVNAVTLDSRSDVWVATQKGVDRFDQARGCFDHVYVDDNNKYVIDITRSSQDRICIITRRDLLELDRESDRFLRKIKLPHLTSSEPQVFFDVNDMLWLRQDNVLFCYDSDYSELQRYVFQQLRDRVLFDGTKYIWLIDGDTLLAINTHSLMESEAGELFPELYGKRALSILKINDGIMVVNTDEGPFLVDVFRDSATDMAHADGSAKTILEYVQAGCRAMQTEPNGNLWASNKDGGFIHYVFSEDRVPANKAYVDFLVSGNVSATARNSRFEWLLSDGTITTYDRQDDSFIKTQYLKELTKMDVSFMTADEKDHLLLSAHFRSARPLELFRVDMDGSLVFERSIKLPYAGIGTIDKDGRIFAAGAGTVIMGVDTDGSVREIAKPFNDYSCYATLMKPLSDGSILICFTDHPPVILHTEEERVEVLESAGLDQVYYSSFVEDASGRVWIGSTDKGLYLYDKTKGPLIKVDSYPETVVNSLAADAGGNIFVTGDYRAVYRFGTQQEAYGRPVWADYSDYPLERRLYPLSDGSVVLVGQKSYVWFSEERINSKEVPDILTHVYLTTKNRIIASFRTDDFPSHRMALRLRRETEDLNLYIGVLDRTNPFSRHSFYYDINHFRTGPQESLDNPQIPLYGVSRPYNTVRFWVTSSSMGAGTDPFTIVVKMNLLLREIISLAVVLMMLVVASVFWILSRKKKKEAEAEKLKREMIEKLNMENIDFFANISYEFQAPLTLINGAATSLTTEDTKSLGMIRRNTDRMMRLVSQMLDFNKLDHGILKLHVKEDNVREIVRAVKTDFEIGASMKGLQLNLLEDGDAESGYVDRDKLEKILYNLCSNAVKYTPPGGQIDISFTIDPDGFLQVSIADTGIVIPEDALEAVFERFYRTKGTGKAGGTGIGLYYTRALVNLHHGSIRAKVRKADEKIIGSVFSFSIPLQKEAYSVAEREENMDTVTNLDRNGYLGEYADKISETGTDTNKPSVVLIDDDYEIIYYLKNLLSDSYNVHFRFDAMSGYKMIKEVQPDVIVCDMMMVEMDGLQLCHVVKENITISHIPFVMLTAKSTLRDQIDILSVGAEAYVVKPFAPEYLLALIKSMIDNRNRMRKMLSSSLSVPNSSKDVLSGQDKAFMEKLYAIMKASMSNGKLDIDPIAEKLGVSRSKFYYKVKALTGQTPNDFFTTYKLNYAAELLKIGKYKISAIADTLDFSSSSHFAAQFRKKFGVLPSQYFPRSDTNP
jgi:signal transduction histidine kinase/DNA-binding response OmpR family regulator